MRMAQDDTNTFCNLPPAPSFRAPGYRLNSSSNRALLRAKPLYRATSSSSINSQSPSDTLWTPESMRHVSGYSPNKHRRGESNGSSTTLSVTHSPLTEQTTPDCTLIQLHTPPPLVAFVNSDRFVSTPSSTHTRSRRSKRVTPGDQAAKPPMKIQLKSDFSVNENERSSTELDQSILAQQLNHYRTQVNGERPIMQVTSTDRLVEQ